MNVKRLWGWVLMVSLGAPGMVFGTTFVQTNAFILGPGEMLVSDLWLMANNIRMEGVAWDDLFLLATTDSPWREDSRAGLVTLAGEFHSDVWAMGNTVELTGIIHDHARFVARAIRLRGSIARSSLFLGNTIHVTRSADIAADVWMAGENLIAEGWFAENAVFMGKNVTLAGTFGQDVHVTAQDLVALPGTEIMGNLTYRCPKEFVPDSRVVIHGRLIRAMIPEKPAGFSRVSFLYQSLLFLGALLTGIIVTAIFPLFTAHTAQRIRYSTWKCMATGLIMLGLSPLVVLLAGMSIIGIPFGLLLLGILAILAYLAKIVAAIALGNWLLRRPESSPDTQLYLPLIVGLLFIYASVNSGLPGLAIWLLVTSSGLGACVLTILSGKSRSAEFPPPPFPMDRTKSNPP